MASKKYRRGGTNRKRGASTKSKNCSKGGRKSSRRARTDKKRTHKWHQNGCQSGGGSMTGGWPWGPSDVQHIGGGGGIGGVSPVPQSINGNHYPLNTNTLAPPQSSNHLVEKGQYGGKRTRSAKNHRRRHRKFIGEQHGGMAEYLPDVANTTLRIAAGAPQNITNALQGASTAFVSRDPTVQPIGQPVQLK
jgi:hypothetical protein